MKKKNILPVVVLSVICIVVAALLAVVNSVTEPIITDREEAKANAALLVVLPGAKNFEELELSDAYPAEVKKAHKADLGFVFEVVTKGKDFMTVMCGVDNEGKIVKLDVIKEAETPGYKELALPFVTGDGGAYNGVDAEGLKPELYTGATMTSNGIYKAVKAVLDAYTVAKGGEITEEEEPSLARPESEVLNLAAELVDGATGFTKAELDGEYNNLISVYKENGGLGYVAYVLVVSESYGTVESEALIYIGANGKIKDVNKLVFKTSDAMYGYVPPTEETVNEFYGRLPGNSSASIGSVELVSNATNTSTNAVASFKEALDAVAKLIALDMPTPEEELIPLASELVGEGANLESVDFGEAKYIRRVYRDKGGRGYVAYVVVISENYGTVESEALLHVGMDGKIKDVSKLTFKTSEAIYGYVPPTEETVNEFYGRLPGKNSASIESVELVSNATNTSTNAVASFKEALDAVAKLISVDMPTPEAEVISLARQLVGEGADLESVDFGTAEYIRRIYKDKGGNGYVAYVVVISENYGTVESETLVHIGMDGRIKGVSKLTFKTSDAIYGYVPPTEATVNAYYDRLPGNNAESLESVELVSNATNTSTNLRSSLMEALDVVEDLIANQKFDSDNTYKIIGISALAVALIIFTAAVVISKKKRGGRNG